MSPEPPLEPKPATNVREGKTPRSLKESAPIPDHILGILRGCTVEAREDLAETPFVVRIGERLAGADYELVDEIFERLRGKYLPGRRVHGFPSDPRPLLETVLRLAVMPPRNPLDFFRTTAPVLARFETLLSPDRDELSLFSYRMRLHRDGERRFKILEPSAGDGAILDLLRRLFPEADLFCCELDPFRRSILERKGYTVIAENFLDLSDPEGFDIIAMNSPFRDDVHGHGAYISHIRKAFSLLRDCSSQLVAVAPIGFLTDQNQPFADFLTFILEYGHITDLPHDAFAESGTIMSCALLWIGKKPVWPYNRFNEPVDGFPNGYVYLFFNRASFEYDYAQRIDNVIRRMIIGDLVVYSNGRPAPETREAILSCCREISADARRKQLHIPVRRQDEEHFVEHFLKKMEHVYDERVGELRQAFRQKPIAALHAASQRVEAQKRAIAGMEETIADSLQKLSVARERLKADLQEEARLKEMAADAPEWVPPVRPDPPAARTLLDLLDWAQKP